MELPQDPFVRELLPEFVDSWLDDIENQFDEFVSKKNSEELYRLAHTLKGSCFQFGLNDIANYGIELMGYAKELDWRRASELKPKIVSLFNEVKAYLNNNES